MWCVVWCRCGRARRTRQRCTGCGGRRQAGRCSLGRSDSVAVAAVGLGRVRPGGEFIRTATSFGAFDPWNLTASIKRAKQACRIMPMHYGPHRPKVVHTRPMPNVVVPCSSNGTGCQSGSNTTQHMLCVGPGMFPAIMLAICQPI
jgi:hypothetical protein